MNQDEMSATYSLDQENSSEYSPVIDESCQMTIDNSQNIIRTLRKLYHRKEMCDVILKVGDKEYGAHKLILCASSDVFQVMLTKPEWSEWHESRIELQEMPICESVFPYFLEYLYTGKILITHTNVMPIVTLADKYMVKGLSRICLSYMCNHVSHAASHNQLYTWLQYSMACCDMKLYDTCMNYIKWNFKMVTDTPDFSNFDVDIFIKILEQDDIVVNNEMVLYNCVNRWLDLQKLKIEENVDVTFKSLMEKVMRYIRFPMMTPRELANLLLSPLINQHKEFLVDRMAIGMKYHSGSSDQLEPYYNSAEGRMLFTPRLYTSDSCSALLLIENFWSLQNYSISTFVFSSHVSAAEHESHIVNEWLVDLYPKGIWFKKCQLIVWYGTLEVPEEILPTVRLSLTCRELSETSMRVKVYVLIYGCQGGEEHVIQVRHKVHHFCVNDKVMNMDDLIPFQELNPPASNNQQDSRKTPYLVGPNRDQLKLNIVIVPIR